MENFQCLLSVLKRSYICYYINCMTVSLRTKLLDRFFVLIDVKYVFFSTHYPNKLLLETKGKFFSSQIFENVIVGFK